MISVPPEPKEESTPTMDPALEPPPFTEPEPVIMSIIKPEPVVTSIPRPDLVPGLSEGPKEEHWLIDSWSTAEPQMSAYS